MNNVLGLKQKMCALTVSLVVDQQTKQPHYVAPDMQYCQANCKQYDQLAQKCMFDVMVDRQRNIENLLLKIERDIILLRKEKPKEKPNG